MTKPVRQRTHNQIQNEVISRTRVLEALPGEVTWEGDGGAGVTGLSWAMASVQGTPTVSASTALDLEDFYTNDSSVFSWSSGNPYSIAVVPDGLFLVQSNLRISTNLDAIKSMYVYATLTPDATPSGADLDSRSTDGRYFTQVSGGITGPSNFWYETLWPKIAGLGTGYVQIAAIYSGTSYQISSSGLSGIKIVKMGGA